MISQQRTNIRKALLSVGAFLLISSPSYAADTTDKQQNELNWFEYVDQKGCFVAAGDQVRPVLPLIVSADGILNMKHELILAAIDAALARGCDINQPDLNGLSALNTAILQGNVRLANYLLDKGADWKKQIEHADKGELNGLDSMDFLALMKKLRPERFEQKQMGDIVDLINMQEKPQSP